MTDSVIVLLQRERARVIDRVEMRERLVADAAQKAKEDRDLLNDLVLAIVELGGDGSDEACREAREAMRLPYEPQCEQETKAVGSVGFIAG